MRNGIYMCTCLFVRMSFSTFHLFLHFTIFHPTSTPRPFDCLVSALKLRASVSSLGQNFIYLFRSLQRKRNRARWIYTDTERLAIVGFSSQCLGNRVNADIFSEVLWWKQKENSPKDIYFMMYLWVTILVMIFGFEFVCGWMDAMVCCMGLYWYDVEWNQPWSRIGGANIYSNLNNYFPLFIGSWGTVSHIQNWVELSSRTAYGGLRARLGTYHPSTGRSWK